MFDPSRLSVLTRRSFLTGTAALAGGVMLGASGAARAQAGSPGDWPRVSVTDPPFGAVADGHTDATGAIQSAIDHVAARGGGTVLLPPGRYRISAPLLVNDNDVHLVGVRRQTVLTRVIPTRFLQVGTPDRVERDKPFILAQSVSVGDMRVSLTPGSAVPPIGWMVLANTADATPRGSHQSAELVHVRAFDGQDAILSAPVRRGHPKAAGAGLIGVRWLDGVSISGISFDGMSHISGENLGDGNVLDLLWCSRPSLRDLAAWELPNIFISLEGCLQAEIRDIEARDMLSAKFEGAGRHYGYVVLERDINLGASIHNLRTERVRHAYTTAASGRRLGVPTGTRIYDSIALASRGSAFDTHPLGEDIAFVNCAAIGSQHVGFQVRSKGTMLHDCLAEDCLGPALSVTRTSSDTHVVGFTARRTNSGTFLEKDWRTHGALYDWGQRTTISQALIEDSAGAGLELGAPGDGGVYRDIRIINPGRHEAGRRAAVKISGDSVRRFTLEDCTISATAYPVEVGIDISAPGVEDGFVRNCRSAGTGRVIEVDAPNVRIVE